MLVNGAGLTSGFLETFCVQLMDMQTVTQLTGHRLHAVVLFNSMKVLFLFFQACLRHDSLDNLILIPE